MFIVGFFKSVFPFSSIFCSVPAQTVEEPFFLPFSYSFTDQTDEEPFVRLNAPAEFVRLNAQLLFVIVNAHGSQKERAFTFTIVKKEKNKEKKRFHT